MENLGEKVKGETLGQAIRKTGLREHLPSRMTRHMLADAAESPIVCAWLHGFVTLEESVTMLAKTDDATEGFSQMLATIKGRIMFS